MAEQPAADETARAIVSALVTQLEHSRLQEERLKGALTRVLKLVDEATPRR